MAEKKPIEETDDLTLQFNSNGLLPVIAQDADTGRVLMTAYMNKEALAQTIETGFATYFSRSRQKLWKKGEQSGHFQKVKQILVDCDQDCLLLKVSIEAGQCHAGYQSCFYRELDKTNPQKLNLIAKKVFNPEEAYNK